MRAGSGRRVRRTEEDWTKIYQRFDSSDVGAREFCRREGVPLSSFQRRRTRGTPRAAGKFVDLSSPAGAPVASWDG